MNRHQHELNLLGQQRKLLFQRNLFEHEERASRMRLLMATQKALRLQGPTLNQGLNPYPSPDRNLGSLW